MINYSLHRYSRDGYILVCDHPTSVNKSYTGV